MSGQTAGRNQRGIMKLVAVVVLAVVAVGGFGVYWYFIRDTAPEKAKLTERTTVAPTSGPDGAWTIEAGDTTYAGLRIDEDFGPVAHTAVMRTPKVTGGFTLSGTTITNTTITADLTALESKDEQPPGPPVANRIRSQQQNGLQIAQFPDAKFVQTGPITLASAPKAGEKFTVQAAGKFTLHGVTKDVTIPIEASWNGELVDITGSLDVKLADYDITPPNLGFVSVKGSGTMEFAITFSK